MQGAVKFHSKVESVDGMYRTILEGLVEESMMSEVDTASSPLVYRVTHVHGAAACRNHIDELETIINSHPPGPGRNRGIILCRQIGLWLQDKEMLVGRESMARKCADLEMTKTERVGNGV